MGATASLEDVWISTFSKRYGSIPPLFRENEIEAMIPHRHPFLLIDCIVDFDSSRSLIVGQKTIAEDEAVLSGHFPSAPIFPGVLIVEALAQTGGVLIHQMGYRGKFPIIVRLEQTIFRRAVYPKDVLYTLCEGIHLTARGGRMRTRAIVRDQICTESTISYVLTDRVDLQSPPT